MPILPFKCKLPSERLGTTFPIQGSALTYHTPAATISHSQTNFFLWLLCKAVVTSFPKSLMNRTIWCPLCSNDCFIPWARPGKIDNFQNILNFLTERWYHSHYNHHLFLLNPQASCAQYNHIRLFVAVYCHGLSPNKSFSDLDKHRGKSFSSARGGLYRVKFEKHHQQRHRWTSSAVCTCWNHRFQGPSATFPEAWQAQRDRLLRLIIYFNT